MLLAEGWDGFNSTVAVLLELVVLQQAPVFDLARK
jgi:hypothetical protein